MTETTYGDFEWHDEKAETNAAKHGVTFEEAALAMGDASSVEAVDLVHPDRTITLGINPITGLLYVVSTEGNQGRTRIISARKANRDEQGIYRRRGFER